MGTGGILPLARNTELTDCWNWLILSMRMVFLWFSGGEVNVCQETQKHCPVVEWNPEHVCSSLAAMIHTRAPAPLSIPERFGFLRASTSLAFREDFMFPTYTSCIDRYFVPFLHRLFDGSACGAEFLWHGSFQGQCIELH